MVSRNRRMKKNKKYIKNKRKAVKKAKSFNASKSQYREPIQEVRVVEPTIPKLNISTIERLDALVLMRQIFNVQSESYDTEDMFTFITGYIKELNDDSIQLSSDNYGNIYVTKGFADTYPCIISHIDTVHNIIPDRDYMVIETERQFFAIDTNKREPTGIGGDDKNGIYCCLDNLIREDKIKLAFFVDEEVGCAGSSVADMSFFEDVSFVLQADRQGYADVVNDIMYTTMFDINFLNKIEDCMDDYGRKLSDGGMTDVMQLAHNGLNVAMANFSCGYYKPHSSREYIVIDELILTSILFRDIISNAYFDGDKNEIIRVNNSYDYYGGWGDYGGYNPKDNPKQLNEYYSELESDDDITKNHSILSDSEPIPIHDEVCTYCGQPTMWDSNEQLPYCNNCMDYDYNNIKFQ